MKTYYDDGTLKIRSMNESDSKVLFDTYASYGWHPQLETYENYLKEQEAGERLVFIPEYRGQVAGICTLVIHPTEGPFAAKGWPEIVDLCVFFNTHNVGIGNKLLDVAEAEAAKYADHVFLAVGVHSGYGPAQRIYAKRGYVPDGTGVWYQGKQLDEYAPCVNDDDLLLFLSKKVEAVQPASAHSDVYNDIRIEYLPKEEWKGTKLPIIDYTTEWYYDVEATEEDDCFTNVMRKKKFETPVTHSEEEYGFPDGLYEDHWEAMGAEAYGVVQEVNGEKKLLACIEICSESWSNRMIVTNMWVSQELRRQHVGKRLMDLAKQKAREQGRRVLMLETQSCNTVAIAFYRAQGYRLIGYDTCCYTNRDIERKEVRFNFGYFFDEEK